MASPHVTGAAALAPAANPGASPAAIASFLVGNATPNRIGSVGSGSPNLLLYSLAGGAGRNRFSSRSPCQVDFRRCRTVRRKAGGPMPR